MRFRVLSLAVALAAAGPFSAPAAAHAAAPRAAALPAAHLEFGLSNGPDELSWMTSSGVPWRYRFQYLAGGVDTGHGWATWNSPAGQFATDYMNASTTSPAAYLPVFTYYMLLQSSPRTGSESDRDYQNLNNATLMRTYYGDFKLLMQKAGAYGSQVVVHVEPDLWGYLQQRAAGGGPTSLSASVASSGFPEASGLPDNVQGFALELLKLRDTYAPNASMAIHASMWSSGLDVASNTDPNLDPAAEARKTAAFLNGAGISGNAFGISSWDAVFDDVDDHDAAWWELASCGSPPCTNQWFTHWWDPANTRFPNFTRYLAWVSQLHAGTGRQQVVWQVPMGNQYFLTMDNTCGHYQDNVAPYFIAHADQLLAAGLVAVMFGGGNSCQTTYDDTAAHDGVTNGNGAPISDPQGGCSACNTHTSTYADDDGGYLRIFVGDYYAGLQTPVPGNGSTTYTLDRFGGVHAAGTAPPLAGAPAFGFDIARGLAIDPDGAGGVELDGYGGLHPLGANHAGNGPYWPGFDIGRALALAPANHDQGWVLDGWGGIHAFGGAHDVVGSYAYWPHADIARALLLLPDSPLDNPSGYVMDLYGGMHAFGLAQPLSNGPYWPGYDIARGAELFAGATLAHPAGYVLDGFGGLHPFGSAPAVAGSYAYWPGFDIARGLTLWSGAPAGVAAGWTLDGFGGLHPFGGAPNLRGSAYQPGNTIFNACAAGF